MALPITADPAPITAELEALLDGDPCFAAASMTRPQQLQPDSGLSLRLWWERGGEWWLRTQLSLGDKKERWVVIPPSTRRTVATDVGKVRPHPLAAVACPVASVIASDVAAGARSASPAIPTTAADAACGRETAGWMLRAEQHLASSGAARRLQYLEMVEDGPAPSYKGCITTASAADPLDRFGEFTMCLQRLANHGDALPLGRFRSPATGWIVIRGRRGHHGYCDEVRAYDLASGAAYVVKSCGGLVLRADGTIDHRATSAGGGRPTAQVGRLPVLALREAALMGMLSAVSDVDIVVDSYGRHLPPAIEPEGAAWSLGALGASGSASSGRTSLEIAWVREGKGQGRWSTDWPDSDRPVIGHATDLLAVAEAGLVLGACAPAALPAIPWTSLGARLDGEPPASEGPTGAALRAELEALRARTRICP